MTPLAVFILLLGPPIITAIHHFDDNIFYPSFKAIFEKRCNKNTDATTSENILNFMKYFDECVTDINAPIPSIVARDYLRYFCTDIYPTQNKCTKTLSEKIAPCLVSQEQVLGQFFYNAYNDSSDYLCQQKSLDYWKTEFVATKAVQCMIFQTDIVKKCLKDAKLLKDLGNPELVLTQTLLCSAMTEFSGCVTREISTTCSEPNIIKFFSKRYTLLTEKCLN